LNLYNLEKTPLYNLDADMASFQQDLSERFNDQLTTVLNSFEDDNPLITLFHYDVHSLLRRIVNNPGTYGFDNVEDICPSFALPDDFSNDNNYLFWDTFNPTTEAHAIIADRVYDLVKPANKKSGSGSGGGCFIKVSGKTFK